jgi:MOSC domain-containing protein YiiM
MTDSPLVVAVCSSPNHNFSKFVREKIYIISGIGVENDVHSGKKVKHRSRVTQNPNQPNLRQVHLIHVELFEELKQKGFEISCGEIGENITTKNLDLLNLPRNTILEIGATAKIKVTGLRNPCYQLNDLQDGLMNAVLEINNNGELIRKAGIMGIVIKSGEIKAGDLIKIELPNEPFEKLERV